jgi:predicted NBD/HSP70 family sugar kinase
MTYALIEGGGTKFVLGTAGHDGTVIERHRLATTSPEKTLGAAVTWFLARAERYAAVGIACFGPLELDRRKSDWGHMLRTVKPHWSGADIAGRAPSPVRSGSRRTSTARLWPRAPGVPERVTIRYSTSR